MSSVETKKKIILKSSDGEMYEVEEEVAIVSETLKNLIKLGGCSKDEFIPIQNVSGKILAMVIEYSKKHASQSSKETLNAFDAEFVKVDDDTLFQLLLAADYLFIKGLLDLISQTFADKIKDMSVEDVRKFFNITNDFTPEEEAAFRAENDWAFEN